MPEPEPENKPKPVRLTEVSYGMTVSLPNYENVRFSLTAVVSLDDDWRDVLESLRRKSRKLKERIQNEGD